MIKQIALDLDGTLAMADHQVSQATREALYSLHHDEDVQVVIATGRRYRTTRYVIDNLGFEVFAVCNGGALVKTPDQQTLHADDFNVGDLAALARENGLTVFAQRDAHHLGGPDFLIDDSNHWNAVTHSHLENNRQWCDKADLTADAEQFLVCGCFGPEADVTLMANAVNATYPDRFDVINVPHLQTGMYYCEISQKQVDKWSGLSRIHDNYAFHKDEVCAVGDQLNDVPMIEACGHGIAMADGSETLKQMANYVCGPNDADGIVDAVNYIRRVNGTL